MRQRENFLSRSRGLGNTFFFLTFKNLIASHLGINFILQGSTKTKEELKSLEKQIAERQRKQKAEEKKGSGGRQCSPQFTNYI